MLAYACQIYCDFTGYSDMAIGCAKWFGFELPQNFRLPYLSRSIAEFWRRWHITLSTWMRDYLYIRLGGSRQGGARTAMNLIATMTLCGLWHGASWNYVLWGFYNGVLLALHRIWDRMLTGRAARRRPGNGASIRRRLGGDDAPGVHRFSPRPFGELGRLLARPGFAGRPGDVRGCIAVPALVPLLVGLVAVGHWLGGWRGVRVGLDLPAAPPSGRLRRGRRFDRRARPRRGQGVHLLPVLTGGSGLAAVFG